MNKHIKFIYGLLPLLVLSIIVPQNAHAIRDLTFESRNTDLPVKIGDHTLKSPWGYGQPAANYPTLADTDGDGDLDMYVGTGDGTIIFYRNEGGSRIPNFTLENRKFLGIDKSQFILFPTFADTDDDGDLDLYFGEWGDKINYYKNRGNSTEWDYVFATGSESAVDVKNFAAPEFVDIDNDNDLDLFVGNFEGRIFFYENAGDSETAQYVLSNNQYADIEVNEVAVPRFVDIDNDGDFDLFLASDNGKIAYYKNVGSARVPEFQLHDTNFIVIQESHLYPAFADIDNDGDVDVFIGNNLGEMYYYENTGNASQPNFIQITDEYFHLDVGAHSYVNFVDLDDDADQDMFILNHNGTLHQFSNTNTESHPKYELTSTNLINLPQNVYGLKFGDIDGDLDMDIIVGYANLIGEETTSEKAGKIDLYKNIGSVRTPKFLLMENFFGGIDTGEASSPDLNDYDEDGDLDLFIGDDQGRIHLYKNTGDARNSIFTLETNSFEDINVESYAMPHFTDIDNDGDYDAIIGNKHGRVFFYENVKGNIGKNFLKVGEILGDLGNYTFITTYDINHDNKMDIFVGSEDGNIHHFKQTSTNIFPPEEVTNLNATVNRNNIMTITWDPSADSEKDLKEYRLYEKTGNAYFTGSTGVGKSTSHIIVEPNKNLTYGFKVAAVDTSGLQNEGVEIEVRFTGDNYSDYEVQIIEHYTESNSSDTTQFCAGFPDVQTNDVTATTCEAIQFVKLAGIFTGTAEGNLEKDRPINRAEVTKVLIEAFDFDIENAHHNEFTDVHPTEWYANYIHTAKINGIVEGYSDRSFRPGKTINKVELLKVVLEIAAVDFSTIDIGSSLYDDIEATAENEWFLKYTNFAHENGLLDTAGNVLSPGEDMTREDVIQLLYRLKQRGLAFN